VLVLLVMFESGRRLILLMVVFVLAVFGVPSESPAGINLVPTLWKSYACKLRNTLESCPVLSAREENTVNVPGFVINVNFRSCKYSFEMVNRVIDSNQVPKRGTLL
jgi:hypothetical protein